MKFSRPFALFLLFGALACGEVDPSIAYEDDKVDTISEALYSTTWSGTLDLSGTDAAIVSRGTDLLDLFRIDGGSLKYKRYNGTWQSDVSLGKPSGVTQLYSVAAANNGGRLDVFAVGSDQRIWHRWSTNFGTGSPTWNTDGWKADIPNNPTVKSKSSLAVTSWGEGRLDIFWWTTNNKLGHAWGEDFALNGSESGDTSSKTYLQPIGSSSGGGDLSVTSWGWGRLDIFFARGGTTAYQISHHWYDEAGNGWGTTSTPNRENWSVWNSDTCSSCAPNIQPSHVGVATSGVNNLEIYVLGTEGNTESTELFRTTYNGSWSIAASPPAPFRALNFQVVEHSETPTPQDLHSVLRWNGGSRLDLFGDNGTKIWQAFRL